VVSSLSRFSEQTILSEQHSIVCYLVGKVIRQCHKNKYDTKKTIISVVDKTKHASKRTFGLPSHKKKHKKRRFQESTTLNNQLCTCVRPSSVVGKRRRKKPEVTAYQSSHNVVRLPIVYLDRYPSPLTSLSSSSIVVETYSAGTPISYHRCASMASDILCSPAGQPWIAQSIVTVGLVLTRIMNVWPSLSVRLL
jgi:hypothetical protein